jgi:hypothetical protein
MSDDDKLEAIWQAVQRLEHSVEGNGRPGLLDRMTIIEIQQRDCPAREAYRGETRRANLSNLIAAAALLASAFAIWAARLS